MSLEQPDQSWILPIFPLPNTVFFPGTSLPLRVFEPRYKAMIHDIKDGDGLFVVSLKAGDGFKELGTVGRIRSLMPLEDGGFKLQLIGLERVFITEVPSETPYRQVSVEPRPEDVGTEDESMITKARLDLLASYGMLRSMVRANEPLILHQGLPFDLVVNMACAGLPIDSGLQQKLLGVNTLIERQRLALKFFSTAIETLSWLRAMKDSGRPISN